MTEIVGENISRVFQDLRNLIGNMARYIGKNVAASGDAVLENQENDFAIVVGYDERPGFLVQKGRVVVSGVPGTISDKQITVAGSAIIRNMTLKCEGNEPALIVNGTGRCILQNCHIVKGDGLQGAADSYLSIEAGGYLNVISCMFHGTQTNGFVVSNAGAANNVDVTGCVNLTTRGHNPNVTVVGEVP